MRRAGNQALFYHQRHFNLGILGHYTYGRRHEHPGWIGAVFAEQCLLDGIGTRLALRTDSTG